MSAPVSTRRPKRCAEPVIGAAISTRSPAPKTSAMPGSATATTAARAVGVAPEAEEAVVLRQRGACEGEKPRQNEPDHAPLPRQPAAP